MFAKIFSIVWKVIVVVVSCYLAVAFLIYFLKPKKIDYVVANDYGTKLSRLSLRPIMDLAFQQRVSQMWDWKEFKVDNYRQKESDNTLIKTNNPNEKYINDFLDKSWWDLSNSAQSVILQPEDPNFSAQWMLIRCVEKSNILYCQKSDIIIKDIVKTNIFKQEGAYLGIDLQGNYIKLKNVQVINSDQRRDILYI